MNLAVVGQSGLVPPHPHYVGLASFRHRCWMYQEWCAGKERRFIAIRIWAVLVLHGVRVSTWFLHHVTDVLTTDREHIHCQSRMNWLYEYLHPYMSHRCVNWIFLNVCVHVRMVCDCSVTFFVAHTVCEYRHGMWIHLHVCAYTFLFPSGYTPSNFICSYAPACPKRLCVNAATVGVNRFGNHQFRGYAIYVFSQCYTC